MTNRDEILLRIHRLYLGVDMHNHFTPCSDLRTRLAALLDELKDSVAHQSYSDGYDDGFENGMAQNED